MKITGINDRFVSKSGDNARCEYLWEGWDKSTIPLHGMCLEGNRAMPFGRPNYVQARVHRFIEYSKLLIDKLTAWHYSTSFSGRPTGQMEEVDGFTRSAHSMHYYDSVLVIEKRLIDEPRVRRTGQPSF